jgi:hypothetical protein
VSAPAPRTRAAKPSCSASSTFIERLDPTERGEGRLIAKSHLSHCRNGVQASGESGVHPRARALPEVVERDEPEGELLEVVAAPINPPDLLAAAGGIPDTEQYFPFVPGYEAVGRTPASSASAVRPDRS